MSFSHHVQQLNFFVMLQFVLRARAQKFLFLAVVGSALQLLIFRHIDGTVWRHLNSQDVWNGLTLDVISCPISSILRGDAC